MIHSSRSLEFWRGLESIPGLAAVDAEWRTLFGINYDQAKGFLRPDGRLALSHPCMVNNGCGCQHDVVDHGGDDIVAVCRCECGCETFTLQRSDILVYELDRRNLETALSKVLGLVEEAEIETGLHGTTCIGSYSPYAGFRFPALLTIQVEKADFDRSLDGLLSRYDKPFILLAPTHELCTTNAEKRIKDRKSMFIPLSENVAIGEKRQLRLLHPFEDILAQFHAAHIPSPKEKGSMAFFPTPPDASWGDVSIRFTDGHTVFIRVKSAKGKFNYTQMGMINNKNSDPTVHWELLKKFADSCGEIDWKNSHAHPTLKKQKQDLADCLKEFFRLEGDPIKWDKGSKAYRCRFRILPEGDDGY